MSDFLAALAQTPTPNPSLDWQQFGALGVVIMFLIGISGLLYRDNKALHKENADQTTSYLVVFTQVGQAIPEMINTVKDMRGEIAVMRAERGELASVASAIGRLDNNVLGLQKSILSLQRDIKAQRAAPRRRTT